MKKISKADRIRQLLRQGDWSAQDLADEVGCHYTGAYSLIQRELEAGNVVDVGYRVHIKVRCRLYTWAGDDDLITMAIRAAEYLREHATDHLGQSLANHLMRLSGATERNF